jgi:hypothetical protein
MTDADLLAEAAAELYAGDPAAFTERRGVLAAQARAAGQAAAAKQITALRKPTYSAWLVNQLVRADPDVAAQLSELGQELRSAGAALDGPRLRELSQQRRRLVDGLVRQALQLPGAGPPSAAVREDLTATFGAALADPQVADQLAAGTLVRAVHRADFAPSGPGLTLVPPLPADRPSPSRSRTPAPATGRTRSRSRGDGQAAAGAAAPARPGRDSPRTAPAGGRDGPRTVPAAGPGRPRTAPAAERDRQRAPTAAEQRRAAAAAERERQRAERERQRQQAEQERQRAIAEAEQAVAEAAQAEAAAAAAERDQRAVVRHLEDQLSEARQQLTEARRKAREAADTERAARRALGRLRS